MREKPLLSGPTFVQVANPSLLLPDIRQYDTLSEGVGADRLHQMEITVAVHGHWWRTVICLTSVTSTQSVSVLGNCGNWRVAFRPKPLAANTCFGSLAVLRRAKNCPKVDGVA
jgi:hypothetical protein